MKWIRFQFKLTPQKEWFLLNETGRKKLKNRQRKYNGNSYLRKIRVRELQKFLNNRDHGFSLVNNIAKRIWEESKESENFC